MSVIMAATSHTNARHVHRPHYPLASSTGDVSYSPAMLERYRKPLVDAYSAARHAPPSNTVTRGSEYSTSHVRTRSYVYASPDAPGSSSQSSESPSPRDTRPSLPHQYSDPGPKPTTADTANAPHPTPSLRSSMSFSNTTATASWGISSYAWSSSSSSVCSSPPVSRARDEPREQPRAGEFEHRDDNPRPHLRDAGEGANRKPLLDPPLPSLAQWHTDSWHPTSAERQEYRERQDSWSPQNTRLQLPPISSLPPLQLRRATYPEFVQGSSRPAFPGELHRHHPHRWATASPPPSPSPSTSSLSTNAFSADGAPTDTEPTDEDEFVKSEHHEHAAALLPPLKPDGSAFLPYLSPIFSDDARWGRGSAAGAEGGEGAGLSPPHASSVRVRSSREKAPGPTWDPPAVAGARPTWRVQQSVLPAPLVAQSLVASTPAAEAELAALTSPTPKKYRFVASNPADARGEWREEEEAGGAQRGGPMATSAPTMAASASGTKRRHASASPDSSVDVPLSYAHPNNDDDKNNDGDGDGDGSGDADGPRKRGRSRQHSQSEPSSASISRAQPFLGAFPASAAAPGETSGASGGGGRFPRGPRGAIVPAYHYDTERALKCAFPECGAVLTGKKSETASHMRSHFLQAVGETLECPWAVEVEGGGEGGEGRDGSGGPHAPARTRCGMAFKDSANFGRHVSSKHIKAEEYQCNRCGRPFARRDAALRHMKTLCRVDGAGGSRRKGEKLKGPCHQPGKTEEYEEVFSYDH